MVILGLGVVLATWLPGSVRTTEFCAVCRSARRSTAFGLFWADHPVVAWTSDDGVSLASSFTDTFAAWGHSHTWEAQRGPVRRLALLVFRHTRPDLREMPHVFHTYVSNGFRMNSEFRAEMRALVEQGRWSAGEVEDALLHCDKASCSLGEGGVLDAEVRERRVQAYERLRPLLNVLQQTPRPRR